MFSLIDFLLISGVFFSLVIAQVNQNACPDYHALMTNFIIIIMQRFTRHVSWVIRMANRRCR